MKIIAWTLLAILIFIGCDKNSYELNHKSNDFFFLRNEGADMPVCVRGNTLSKKMIILLHGGPGGGGIGGYILKAFELLEQDYGVVYWDQRSSGSSQGHFGIEKINKDQFVEDLSKLVVLIKYKYGNDIDYYFLGASWGGYLGMAYLIDYNNQGNIKGMINVGGAHNILLVGNESKHKLIRYGKNFINNSINKGDWTEIVTWCENKDTIQTNDEYLKINSFAVNAEINLLGDSIDVIEPNIMDQLKFQFFSPYSQNSAIRNAKQIQKSPLVKNFYKLNLSPELYKITIPVLFIGGKHDLIVPNEVLYEAHSKINSEIKEIVILDKSGHFPDKSQPENFYNAITEFIETQL